MKNMTVFKGIGGLNESLTGLLVKGFYIMRKGKRGKTTDVL